MPLEMAQTAGLPKTPTGIVGFDDITLGGLPTARPSLICGAAGCGGLGPLAAADGTACEIEESTCGLSGLGVAACSCAGGAPGAAVTGPFPADTSAGGTPSPVHRTKAFKPSTLIVMATFPAC